MSAERCVTCNRDPERANNHMAECSHVDCPHRRRCWSERPTVVELFRGPWSKTVDADPEPLDGEVRRLCR